jgi:hypothetical protein
MQILWNRPALLLEDALVIGDLHIGLEQELFSRGVRLASCTERMKKQILELLGETGAKKLIVLGDLKHKIASVSSQEAREIPSFLKALSERAELVLVLGNHDGGLKPFLTEFTVHDAKGFVYERHCLIHGSAKPSAEELKCCDGIIASHWHPVYEFNDPLGGRRTEKVWVQAKALGKPMLIMPSFNPLLGGAHVGRIREKWVDMSDAELFLLDGVSLGKPHHA